jgi:hypothetical protein
LQIRCNSPQTALGIGHTRFGTNSFGQETILKDEAKQRQQQSESPASGVRSIMKKLAENWQGRQYVVECF